MAPAISNFITMVSPNLGNTLGAIEIGILVSVFLFGFYTVQAIIYYANFPDDPKILKGLVSHPT